MNARKAIDKTMQQLKNGVWDIATHPVEVEMVDEHLNHLDEMWDKIKNSEATFSEGKINRWLGWMQATIVICTNATLEEMKQINKEFA